MLTSIIAYRVTVVSRFTWKEFEAHIASYLQLMAHLEGRAPDSYQVASGELIERPGGAFAFDVTIRFRAFGVDYLTVGECKHHRRKIQRSVVNELHSKMESVRAHKGIIFSTSGFQSGAVTFAKELGRIALIDCSPHPAEPVTIIAGEPTEAIDVAQSLPPIAPSSFDWVFHWGGESFCADHWYAAQVLFRDTSQLDPLPNFWRPRPRSG
jgi:hypothetical protein